MALNPRAVADVSWQDAWDSASKLIGGVSRLRVRGGESGVEISMLDWGGEGDLVLLHHANGFCGATLAPIANALSDRYRVVTMDARGHGDSTSVPLDPDPEAYRWQRLSTDLRAAVHHLLEIVERDHVEIAIGHSFGGALILDSAQNEPGLFRNLLLCDPVILDSTMTGENQAPSRGPDLAAGARKRRARFASRAEAFEHFRSRPLFAGFTPESLALYVGEGIGPTSDGDFALKCKPEVEAAIFSGGALRDLFIDAGKVTANVRFLHASRGNFSRERYEALASRMTRARVESLDVGHLFPLEEPEHVLAKVDELIHEQK